MPAALPMRGDASELAFLRREVSDLERVIKSLHSSRTDDKYALEQAQLAARHESALREDESAARESALHELRVQHAAALSAAASRDAETRILTVELRLLCAELFDAEAEREAARESETSALSIARSYRGFAAQGAQRLEELRGGMEGMQGRLLQRLGLYQIQAHHCLKVRALRSARGWRAARELSRSLTKWMLLVRTAEQRESVAARLEAAYRHRDLQSAAQRMHSNNERREYDEARAALQDQVVSARRERDSAMREAEAATAARHEAERVSELLRGQLAQAQQQVESARRKESADVAAAREQLVVSKRETAAANASLASAREAQRAAEASLAECKAALASKDVEVSMANEAQEEEGRTRVFLERVLKDERNHAARRAEVRHGSRGWHTNNRTART